MNRAAALFLAFIAVLFAVCAHAHEVRPAYLQIDEKGDGVFDVLFKTPMRGDARLALTASLSGPFEVITPMVARQTGDAMVQNWRISTSDLAGQTVAVDGLRSTMRWIEANPDLIVEGQRSSVLPPPRS